MIDKLNKAFENRVRLGIMSVLLVNDKVEFNQLKELLKQSDGNIASHIAALEILNYIKVEKKFVGKKPNTSYKVTAAGRNAFNQHLDALEELLNRNK